MRLIGIDPGPVVGVVLLEVEGEAPGRMRLEVGGAMQVTAGLLEGMLHSLCVEGVAIERFVVGPRAGRSRTPAAGQVAREVVEQVRQWAIREDLVWYPRSAAEVKPWATDARLRAAGLLDLTKGMNHARDAARHGLFSAVKDWHLTDPLSAAAGAR